MLEIAEGCTIDDVVRLLGIPGDLARVVLVNGREPAPGGRLGPGDVITIYPPLAGGRGSA